MAENSEKSAKKPRGRPFVKGQTGNPGGRPAVNPVFRDRARSAVDQHVLDAWVAEVTPDKEGKRGPNWVKCSELLAAYGYGKPPSAPEDNEALRDGGGGWPLTREETLALAKRK